LCFVRKGGRGGENEEEGIERREAVGF